MQGINLNVYDSSPEQYDSFQTKFFEHGSPAVAEAYGKMFEALALEPDQRVLEVGVGTGLNLPHYPRGVRVTGVDRSEPMLRIARRRADEVLADVELMEADASSLPFEDETFDAVVCTFVLCSCATPRQLLEEIVRCCRVGGRIGLFDFHKAKSNPNLLADQFLLHETLLNGICYDGRLVAVCDSFYQLEEHLPEARTEVSFDRHLEDSIASAFRATTLRRTK